METLGPTYITAAVRWLLTAELFLGGQARVTSLFTPNLHRRAMVKAEGTQRYLSFIPIEDPKQHTRFIGSLMCTAGALLSWKSTRLAGGLLGVFLTLAGVYSQYKMRISYWLPGVNTVLAGVIIYRELAASHDLGYKTQEFKEAKEDHLHKYSKDIYGLKQKSPPN